MTGALLRWYDQERRILPWREDPTPYHVWISEIMLQQTRVEAVIGYYERFLEELPDVCALAEAEEERLLKLWQGLGYYSRARNLRKAAGQIMERHGGVIPSDPAELAKLAGIGEYTAAAIASIAYQVRVPSVDGNLLRVCARVRGYEESIRTPKAKKVAQAYFLELLPEDRPGDVNQALMDLGATICLPNGTPDCGHCPWQSYCEAHRTGRELAIPVREEKRSRAIDRKTVLVIRAENSEGEFRYAIRRRPDRGLLAGLYEFPNTDGHLTEAEAAEACRGLGFRPAGVTRLADAKHVFTHREWHMRGYLIDAEPVDPAEGILLVSSRELADTYSVPAAFAAFQP
ncbi:MAG: A/G-specific adenine glycosylase [Mogibacterium sp.]|nr:A/G-specific adenine glycosylase [Mogibacterium sp.]